jgi:caa(3)-type oxidase subunit IV
MAEAHEPAAHDHAGPNYRAYLMVFAALSVFTLISFVVNAIFGTGSHTGATIIMIVAVIKATLVAMIFMHLFWDWRKVLFVLAPISILAVVMMVVLMPDVVIQSSEIHPQEAAQTATER